MPGVEKMPGIDKIDTNVRNNRVDYNKKAKESNQRRPVVGDRDLVKLGRAYGGCLGTIRRRRTW